MRPDRAQRESECIFPLGTDPMKLEGLVLMATYIARLLVVDLFLRIATVKAIKVRQMK